MGYGHSVLGLQFSDSFLTCLIMCVGFSVDYCAHVVIAYSNGGHTRNSGRRKQLVGSESSETLDDKEGEDSTKSKLRYTLQVQ